MRVDEVPELQCPDTGAGLFYQGTNLEGEIRDGFLICGESGEAWAVEDGIPRLYRDAWRTGSDARAADLLDRSPRFVEPLYALGNLLVGAGRAQSLRGAVARSLELEGFQGPNLRILEVGVGTGAQVEPVLDAAPRDLPVRYWGTSLSPGVLGEALARKERNLAWKDRVAFFLADPHHLPFATGVFDRVFMNGGVDCLREPRQALKELFRVCAADGMVVLIDKQPDPLRPPGPIQRAALAAIGSAASQPQEAPNLPPGCRNIRQGRLSPVHYVLQAQPPRT